MANFQKLLLALGLWCFSFSYSQDLQAALHRAAGVYIDPAKQKGFEKTVVVTGCNYGFINHLHNFKCFADRLGIKFLVISMDPQAHEYIQNKTNMISYLMDGGKTGEVTGSSVVFRSKQFNLITAKKKESVHDILRLGYDVLFSDTDVAMVRDPFPSVLWSNVDYVHTINNICAKTDTWDFRRSKEEGNTGFYFVRSNNRTIKLWNDAFEAAPKFPHLDDQAIFWRIIRGSQSPAIYPINPCRHTTRTPEQEDSDSRLGELITCPLDTCSFSSGMLSRVWVPEYTYEELLANLKYRNQSMYALHANYIRGNNEKMALMTENGFWLATKGTGADSDNWVGECKPFLADNSSQPVASPAPVSQEPLSGTGTGTGTGTDTGTDTGSVEGSTPVVATISGAGIPHLYPNSLSNNEEFRKVVKAAAGVYADATKNPALARTIIVTGCNHGYLNHVSNFKCFADRLGLKFLVLAMDAATQEQISSMPSVLSFEIKTNHSHDLIHRFSQDKSRESNLLSALKLEGVHEILSLGYDVLFSDIDVAMVQDPFPLLLWENVDFVHALNEKCTSNRVPWDFMTSPSEGDTGFYFMRSNNRTTRLLKDVFFLGPSTPDLDESQIFWRTMRNSKTPPVRALPTCGDSTASVHDSNAADSLGDLVTCPLDSCAFSSSVHDLEDEIVLNLLRRNQTLRTIHPSHLKGSHSKMLQMQKHGLWLSESGATCKHLEF